MTLNLGHDWQNLFPHSKRFEEGVTTKDFVRPGQATVVVALDGSGDANTLAEGIKMLPTGGGVVYIKEGTYKNTGVTIDKAKVQIIGAGSNCILEGTGLANAVVIAATSKNELLIQNVRMRDTGFGKMVKLTTCNDCIIKNCWMGETASPAIDLLGCSRILIDGNFVFNLGLYNAFRCLISGATRCSYISIVNNICMNTGNFLVLSATDDSLVKGNNVPACTVTGILLGDALNSQDANRNVICGNNIKTNHGTKAAIEIEVSTSTDNIICCNYLENPGAGAAILHTNGTNTLIHGNQTDGISITAGTANQADNF